MINTKYNNQSTNRVINSEKRRKSISKPNKKCNRKLVLFIIIIFIIILIAEINILITLFKIKDPNKSNYDPIETEPGYVFSIKKYELKRFSINENYSEDKIINNTFSNLMILYRKAIYDFIVISEEEATEENKKLYNKTYLASVAIAGECINLKNETCEPKRFVDLTDKNNINITELEEIDNLKDFPIYLCLINLTDNNIILSMRCPQALSEVKRNSILSNMKLFRPTTLKRKKKEKRNIMIRQVSDGKNILIREKQGGCCKFGKKINTFCSNDMNITKDLNNNIISITEENKVKTVKNKNNVFFKNKASELIDLTNETKNLNSNDYLNILNKLLKKLEKYMKMEEYLSLEEFNEIYNENKDINIDKNNIINRKLFEARENYEFSGNLFSLNKYDYFGIDFDLNLVNAYPLQDKGVEARNELIIDNNKYQLSNIGYSFDIQGILEKIMKLNIASRYLARKLYNEVGENLNNIDNIIIKNMTNLSTYIVYKNLEEFFNLNLSDMNFLPLDIIVESNNLNNQLKLILNGIINGNLKDKIELLNDDIYNHINKTRLLLNNIYNNFLELEYLLNSPKSKLTEIVTYYLNASSQYNNIIEGANNIFNTYYRKEYDIIVKCIDSILNSSNTVIYNDLKNYTDFIDNLRINIENKNITIKNATENDYKNITTNFANSINLIDEIIYEAKYKLKKGIIFEDSGFFISNNKIDENN